MQEQPRIIEMMNGQELNGYLMVLSATQKSNSNGAKYLDMVLCDISGECSAKLWDGTVSAPAEHSVVRVRARMEFFNGHPQLRVLRLLETTDADKRYYDITQLIRSAPEPSEDMMAEIRNCISGLKDAELRELVNACIEEYGDTVSYYPAASRIHHAEKSGLLHHTLTMLRMAQGICPLYPDLDSDLVYAGIILHDLAKIDELKSDDLGMVSEYTPSGILLGHLVQGVAQIDRIGRERKINPELLMLIEHIVISHHDLPEYGSPKPPMIPEAELVHTLDQLDARLFQMNDALRGMQPGTFTDKLWTLDRKLYKRGKH